MFAIALLFGMIPFLSSADDEVANYRSFKKEISKHCRKGVFRGDYFAEESKEKKLATVDFSCPNGLLFQWNGDQSFRFVTNRNEAWYIEPNVENAKQSRKVVHFVHARTRWAELMLSLFDLEKVQSVSSRKVANFIMEHAKLSFFAKGEHRHFQFHSKDLSLPSFELVYKAPRQPLPEELKVNSIAIDFPTLKLEGESKQVEVGARHFVPDLQGAPKVEKKTSE